MITMCNDCVPTPTIRDDDPEYEAEETTESALREIEFREELQWA